MEVDETPNYIISALDHAKKKKKANNKKLDMILHT